MWLGRQASRLSGASNGLASRCDEPALKLFGLLWNVAGGNFFPKFPFRQFVSSNSSQHSQLCSIPVQAKMKTEWGKMSK